VEADERQIVFDPYQNNSVPGLRLPDEIAADAVYCSHGHEDHNARDLIHVTGGREPFQVSYMSVPHDGSEGRDRGFSNITFVKIGRCTIAHLGDIGRMPTEKEYIMLRKADAVMIPVGGYYTIDALQASEILKNINANLKILMHYREGSRGYEVLADIEDIRKLFPDIRQTESTYVSFEDSAVPKEIITLEPIQEKI
jgi:L-ascorbate metabolism protein UlaG (beta-lactamase superfamily)